jgi:hypothetical protein
MACYSLPPKHPATKKPTTYTLTILIVVLGIAAVSLAVSAAPRSLSITVVGADNGDPRWRAVEEAAEFWNQQLTGAGVDLRLGPITRIVQPVSDDALRQLSAAVVGGYGRVEPEIPQQLGQIPGDIVVALSNADLISFGLQWRPERKGLVGLRRADIPPLSLPNVPRNVTAHELGHVLGLVHNSDSTTLMCGRPALCRPAIFASERNQFFPLTAADIAILRTRWRIDIQ